MGNKFYKGRTLVDTGAIDLKKFQDLAELETDWRAFQEHSTCSFYQTYEWCQAWQTSIGMTRGFTPCVIAGYHQKELIFILPLGIQKSMGARVVKWLGTGEMTYGMGLYCQQYFDLPIDFTNLWPEILNLIKHVDGIHLVRQPPNWQGHANPLNVLFTVKSANASYAMALTPDFEALYEQKRSTSSRRGNRKRDKKLLASGDVHFGLPDNVSSSQVLLETMQEQQAARLSTRGVTGLEAPEISAFLSALNNMSFSAEKPVLLPYHLTVDNEVVAVMLGASFKNTYWALVASLTSSQHLQRLSPGDYALRQTIRDLCDKGYHSFDFSAGESDYKTHWADQTIDMNETVRITGPRGTIWGVTRLLTAIIKRQIKSNKVAFDIASKLRAIIFGHGAFGPR